MEGYKNKKIQAISL